MTAKPPNGQDQRELINYRFDEVFKRLDRMQSTMDSFAYTPIREFEEFKREVKETYATKESVSMPIKLIYGLVVIIVTAVVGAVMSGVLK